MIEIYIIFASFNNDIQSSSECGTDSLIKLLETVKLGANVQPDNQGSVAFP
ncbi:MAG: hypothetical protein QOH50_5254 [Kribbellaceae bacterium]|nr:hypothetical protein [Kribbellaceae bacterium]